MAGEGVAVTPGIQHYFKSFDMGGAKSLRVEARLIDAPPHLPPQVYLRVQGTDDEEAEKKNWVDAGAAIALSSGIGERRILGNMRRQVRVVAEALAPGGVGRIEIRLTRLP